MKKLMLVGLLIIGVFLGFSLGEEWINLFTADSQKLKIIYYLRGPRVIFSVLAGIGLAVSGALVQGITRNPMASPFTLGVSSAAAFGAAVVIVFFKETTLNLALGSFISTLICGAVILGISRVKKLESITLIIIGITLNYLFTALTSTLQYITSEEKLASIVKWTFGSLNGVMWEHNIILLIVLIFVFIYLRKKYWIMNLISNCDDDYILTLGVKAEKEKLIFGLVSIVLTSLIISVSGIIGFVGLVSPYIGKRLVGNNYKNLLIVSGLIGGVLIVYGDILGRNIVKPLIIPIGIVLSYIGVPILLKLILKKEVR